MADLKKAASALRTAASRVGRLSGESYKTSRMDYRGELFEAVETYLNGGSRGETLAAAMRSLMFNSTSAATRGYQDGAEDKAAEPELDDVRFLQMRQAEESAFLSSLWNALAAQRAQKNTRVPADRLNQYVNSLDGLYNEFKLRGAKAMPLTFVGEDGQESCATCRRLKGKTRKASWWVENGMIPGAANMNYDCKGFRCQHYLTKKNGQRFTR